MWLINTHNGIKGKIPRIDINEYPAVKAHLDKYWSIIKDRADQGDTPYNLRNCAYWDVFSRPKIVWKRVGSIIRFAYDESGIFSLDSTCMATGDKIQSICCILNSKMGHFLLKDAPQTGTGDLLISVQAVEPIRVPYIDDSIDSSLTDFILGKSGKTEEEIDEIIFNLYKLSEEEKDYIKTHF